MENGTVTQPKEKANLAVVGAMPMDQGLVVRSFGEAMDLAKILASSALIPEALRGQPSDVLVIMLKGMELGLKTMQSLNEIFVVKGRPGCSAALKRALCLQSALCLKFDCIETTDKKATFMTQRKGSEPVRLTWTIEQAATAGLMGKDVWKSHPAAMLRARASSALADLVFPDVVQGLASNDELEEIRGGQVMSVKVNTPPFSNTVAPEAPSVPLEMEIPDEPPDTFEMPVPEKAANDSTAAKMAGDFTAGVDGPATEFDKMSALIDAAVDGKALLALSNTITAWTKNGGNRADEDELRRHFARRSADFRKAGK